MVEYFKRAKKIIPKIFNQLSTQPIQIEQSSKVKQPIINIFINRAQNYIIVVTKTRIEVHDLKQNKKVSGYQLADNILCADFTKKSDFSAVLVVCLEDQNIVIFEPNELLKLKSINVRLQGQQKISVSSINCELGKHIIIGYTNGLSKIIHMKSSKEEFELNPSPSYQIDINNNGATEQFTPVNHIKISERHKMVFIAHEEHTAVQSGETYKHQKTPIHVFNYENGEFQTDYQIPNLSIKAMYYLDTRNSLVLLSSGQRKIYIINVAEERTYLQICTDFENITDQCMISSMRVVPISQKFLHDKQNAPQEYKDECMLIFSLDNGNILTSILRFQPELTGDNPSTFELAQLLPQNLFYAKKDKKLGQPSIQSLTYDIDLDLIVYVDQKDRAIPLRGAFNQIVSANTNGYKTVQYEDPKMLPIFSLRPYKKRNQEDNTVKIPKDSLPLFSIKPNQSEKSNVIDSTIQKAAFIDENKSHLGMLKKTQRQENDLELATLSKDTSQSRTQYVIDDCVNMSIDNQNEDINNLSQMNLNAESLDVVTGPEHNRIYILE